MNRRWFQWWWLVFLVPVAVGLARLRFDVEVLDLLPANVPAVAGLKIYQQHFSNARELIVTVKAPSADLAKSAAQLIAEGLQRETNLVAGAAWQPPWLEHPEQTVELIAYLWLNQPPDRFNQLADRLAETNLPAVLAATRDQLATTLSPNDIAQLSYDPFGFTRLPEDVAAAAPGFNKGGEMFASDDGAFRIIYVEARHDLGGYQECTTWFNAVKQTVQASLATANPALNGVNVGYTGRPAFVTEISGSMKHDVILSVSGTAIIIAILFWLAHRRWRPMLWLLTLLALILAGTLALGGLVFGTISVVSMGFAAILLGLAVDYAVVHYQEALAHPALSVPEIRRAIAPSIIWAAVTTITAFLVLNFGGLPGLAQLGSLVAIGVTLSAFVMIFAYLPPLFPGRMKPSPVPAHPATESPKPQPANPFRVRMVFAVTVAIVLLCAAVLLYGLPKMDSSADALQPRDSQAYATLNAVQDNLSHKRNPLWLVIGGRDESEVGQRLDAVLPVLNRAVSNQVLSSFVLPNTLWPRPANQAANRGTAQELIARREAMRAAALTNGFSEDALGLMGGVLDTWQRAAAATNVFWPDNPLSQWIFGKLAVREATNDYAVGFLFPPVGVTNIAALTQLDSELPREGVWLSSWDLLGGTVLTAVKSNMWKLVLPMLGLILLSLGLAFRRPAEILLSVGVLLLSGLCLLTVMRLLGWSWNLLNLMALPLILGTGVDYSIFMQLALRRYGGDLKMAHQAVGRALLLCGGTAVAGFGSLGLSSNAGMASLGQVCAIGIGVNMLGSVFLLPVWWKTLAGQAPVISAPSQFYGARIWQAGLMLARWLPASLCDALARAAGAVYCRLARSRREVVIQNLLPVLNQDRKLAARAARQLFAEFALKIADLWRYESGQAVHDRFTDWKGWEIFEAAQARGKGVLLVTPHLGNWEFGGTFLVRKGCKLLVLTQPEPDERLTEIRQASRAHWGVETIVVGEDPFAFVEIIKQLQQGTAVALLLDRPPAPTGVTVELFGRPFVASIAAAELARATGCAIVPTYIVRQQGNYSAQILPEIAYDRALIGNRAERIQLTQRILRAFEPVIRQHATQWYHFVPIWPSDKPDQP